MSMTKTAVLFILGKLRGAADVCRDQGLASIPVAMETLGPGPQKCLCDPNQQILAQSAPPKKARNRDKAELATKVRNKYRLC